MEKAILYCLALALPKANAHLSIATSIRPEIVWHEVKSFDLLTLVWRGFERFRIHERCFLRACLMHVVRSISKGDSDEAVTREMIRSICLFQRGSWVNRDVFEVILNPGVVSVFYAIYDWPSGQRYRVLLSQVVLCHPSRFHWDHNRETWVL